MAIIRTQYGVATATVTIADNADTVVDIPRPADAAEANTIDWVKRPAFRKEFESGRAVITLTGNLASAADIYLKKVEIVALNPGVSLAPLNLSFSQFPDVPGPGMPSAVLRTVLDLAAPNAYACNATVTQDLLKNVLLRTSEFVRLTFHNPAGGSGATTGIIACRYDFGLNAGNYGSLPLLI